MKGKIEKFNVKIQTIDDIDHMEASKIDKAEYVAEIQYYYHGLFVS